MSDVDHLIKALGLLPHPEGGFYREIYRASQRVQAGERMRSAATAIYFLLPEGSHSAWHVVQSDEQWHHYAGAPLELHLLADGAYSTRTIGRNVLEGQTPQAMVHAGVIQAARPVGGWALLGCTVAPGFDFADFRMNSASELLRDFPTHRDVINRFLPR